MLVNIEVLNLSQQKEEGIIQYQRQIIILESFSQKIASIFHRKFVSNKNEENRNTYE